MGDVSRDIDPKTRPRDDDPQGQRRWDKMKEVHDYLAQMARSLEAFQAWRVREETTSGPPSSAPFDITLSFVAKAFRLRFIPWEAGGKAHLRLAAKLDRWP